MSTAPQREIRILSDPAAVARRAAEEFVKAATAAVATNGHFNVALSGGSTPKALNAILIGDPALHAKVPWDKIDFFFGDERHVPPDDKDSNFRMTNESLFSKLTLRPEQIHRIRAENPDAEKAALEYQQALRAYFKLQDGAYPRFDLVFFGMGDEGHTLSLFPGTKALHPGDRLVVSNWVGKFYTERITFAAPVANHAAQCIFMVTRADKAPALKAVLEGPYEPEQLPAQLIQPIHGNCLWLIDQAAGSMLTIGVRE